ncbi:Maf family protein [Halonatronum saccharophilum]|uniref:Maf family protein n=1 Tax=Halonatronum saccharophilum TaxID=150060 RepID=UPI000481EBFD|nr:nucleoside triphosphate pyrophosphatase [Halonatronum saccharophilum]
MDRFILASASPRRRGLLEMLDLNFKVVASQLNEESVKEEDPIKLVKKLSYLKAKEVANFEDGVIIGADTVVSLDGEILEKPKDSEDAYRMLSNLSGRTHQVFTGVTLVKGDTVLTDYQKTNVTFRELTNREIKIYIESGQAMDKAGSYGIQDKGSLFVKKVDGCFYNVVGLPLVKLVELLNELGVEVY